MATADDVRAVALSLPKAYETVIADQARFKIGRIVFASLSPDDTQLGFGFPKEERAGLVAAEPEKFMMPARSDERYNWVRLRLDAVDVDELRELVIDAWRMCVSKRTAATYDAANGRSPNS